MPELSFFPDAAAFRGVRPERSRKMKILHRVTALLLAALIAFAGITACASAAAETETSPRTVAAPADADEWIRTLLGEYPETLEDAWQMTLQMKMALALSGGIKGLAASLAGLGPLEKAGSAYEGKLQGYTVFYIPCVFRTMAVDLILATENGAVAGLSTGPYTGNRTAEGTGSDAYDSIELALPVPALSGELPGTLTVPKGEGPFPAVVLVHGSGPSDRDETLMNLKPFRDLAEGLAEHGIAVYRYDKRTFVYGAQLAADRQATLMDETVEDAAAAVQLLAQQDRIDAARIYVLGHSLGGNAIPAIDLALKELPVSACGYILMAASPRPLDVLMREQYDYLYSLQPEITPEQQAEKDALFSDLDRLKDPDSLTENDLIAGAYAPYWQWLAQYDVTGTASQITVPCLLLQGEEDYQVTMEDFLLWKEAIGEKAIWRLVSYPGLTHLFTPGLKAEGAAAYVRAEKVDPRVIGDIADFILKSAD